MSLKELQDKVDKFFVEKKHAEIITLLSNDNLDKFKNANLYAQKARAYFRLEMHDECERNIQEAIKLDPENSIANSYYGHIYSEKGLKEKAIEYYEVALKNDPKNVNAINGLGNIYLSKKNLDEAKKYFESAIEVDSKYEYSYNGLGIVYYNLQKIDLSLSYYDKALSFDADFSSPYYNKALLYQKINKKREAKENFEKYLDLKKGENDFFVKYAKSRVIELKKLIINEDYSKISDLVEKIKIMLCFNDDSLTHYTSLSVSNELIFKNSPFRISEGSFLNDTSEGREFFNFLNIDTSYNKSNKNLAEVFSKKPFIGSFVSNNKYDDLTLWRMYGKEQKEEAGGCAITIDIRTFLDNVNQDFFQDDDSNGATSQIEELKFYRVIYKKNDKDFFFIPNSSQEEQNELNQLLHDLKAKVTKFKGRKSKNNCNIINLVDLLNSIAYLFKSDEYQYENEVRLVLNGNGFEKTIEPDFSRPKVYINLVPLKKSIKRVTLGPKVNRADEWASVFNYCFEKSELAPEILISKLPFK
jgi:tetratricopeptide (TPR) repeat protein